MQRYKVFINQSVFYFTNNSNNLELPELKEVDSTIDYANSSKEFIGQLIEKAEQKKITILFVHHNVEALWKDFITFFEIRIAGGGLVENSKREYLLIFRNGKWDLPKGHIEKGETIEWGALREVEEETGVSSPRLVKLITETFHTYWYGNSRVLKHTYWHFMKKDTENYTLLKPQTEEGITKVEWCSKEETNTRLSKSYSSIQDVWKTFLIDVAQ